MKSSYVCTAFNLISSKCTWNLF